jgi:hypothetical protein
MLKPRFSVFLITFFVASCVKGVGVEQSASAQPGQDLIPPSFAGNFFTEICLTTAPSFENVSHAISGEPFVQHQKTGTYFHKYADLSIKVSDYGCSLVFKSGLGVDETLSELAKGVSMNAENWGVKIPRNIDISSNASPDGKGRYFRVGLRRP